jgi:hypothetical protein
LVSAKSPTRHPSPMPIRPAELFEEFFVTMMQRFRAVGLANANGNSVSKTICPASTCQPFHCATTCFPRLILTGPRVAVMSMSCSTMTITCN